VSQVPGKRQCRFLLGLYLRSGSAYGSRKFPRLFIGSFDIASAALALISRVSSLAGDHLRNLMVTSAQGPKGVHVEGPQVAVHLSVMHGRRVLRALGLGLVTGAADDDPSAIGTYAAAGAALGYSFLWTAPVTLPMMFGVVYSFHGCLAGDTLFISAPTC
jgi:hypothetical protein